MKKTMRNTLFIFAVMFTLPSCYTYTYIEGKGPQTNVEITEKNNYFIYGLAQGRQSNPKQMAGDTEDYRVTIRHTFVDGLLNALTLGIYTPTTTTVTK